MPALTPEQQQLKTYAQIVKLGWYDGDFSEAQARYDALATPDAILALLDQLEAAPVERRTPGEMPRLPQHLLNIIGEYGHARTDGLSDPDRCHLWETLIAAIKNYAWSCLASPAAQVEQTTRDNDQKG